MTKKPEIQPVDTTEATEEAVMTLITNEPSDPIEIPNFKTLIVFKRPPFKEKYKARVWASKKLKEAGYEDADEDRELSFFFRYWGTLNTFVSKIYFESEKGEYSFGGKKYSLYLFDPAKDLDYAALFEKYVIAAIYEKGKSEEMFVSECIIKHTEWLGLFSVEDSEIKNS